MVYGQVIATGTPEAIRADARVREALSGRRGNGMNAMAAPLLDVQDLHAHYGKSHVLHGVDLRVASNEVVSLVGRNGSGRSTTMKAIMGLVAPASGRIRLRDS